MVGRSIAVVVALTIAACSSAQQDSGSPEEALATDQPFADDRRERSVQTISDALDEARANWRASDDESYSITGSGSQHFFATSCVWKTTVENGVIIDSTVTEGWPTATSCSPIDLSVEALHLRIEELAAIATSDIDPRLGQHTLEVDWSPIGVPRRIEWKRNDGADDQFEFELTYEPAVSG